MTVSEKIKASTILLFKAVAMPLCIILHDTTNIIAEDKGLR